ncbi:MAG TPA: Na+/H+ antiporter NhaA [Gammaproteobacteria bacterium]|nr:Na+/H+ antiporter NhaA [Gammaproteobacteria bacterium]
MSDEQQHTPESGNGRYDAFLEKAFNRVKTPFDEFIHEQTTSGLILMACTLVALVLANSPWAGAYQHLLHTEMGFSVDGWQLQKTLLHWVNDGLMALFFFLVGLEIKREILVGELAEPRQAVLPIVAAVGGMVVPALFYFVVNFGGAGSSGWGVPMATDIAFAVGVLVLLGSRVPKTLLTFLVALAIVDDLGAVLVIALFYTEQIVLSALAWGGGCLALLVVFNLVGIRSPLPYFVVGALLWLALLKSGVHATLAGVITALTIPARPKFNPPFFSRRVRALMDEFDAHHRPGASIMTNDPQRAVLQTLENAVHKVETPLQRLEHSLHMPVAFLIIPLFALANAGIPLAWSQMNKVVVDPVVLGIVSGLILGKLAGIAGVSWLAVKCGVAALPAGVSLSQIVGVALLGGIGFTMSIFIAELAFAGQAELLLMAKTGILIASLGAGVGGYLWLRYVARPPAEAGSR